MRGVLCKTRDHPTAARRNVTAQQPHFLATNPQDCQRRPGTQRRHWRERSNRRRRRILRGRCGRRRSRSFSDGSQSGLTRRRELAGIALETTQCLSSARLNRRTMRYEIRAASHPDRIFLLASWLAKRVRLGRKPTGVQAPVRIFSAGAAVPCACSPPVTTAALRQTAMRWPHDKAATARRRLPSDKAAVQGGSVESTNRITASYLFGHEDCGSTRVHYTRRHCGVAGRSRAARRRSHGVRDCSLNEPQ